MILITGDIHLNPNPRDSYRHAFVSETLPTLVNKHNVTDLVILGDLTTDKDFHGAWLVNQIVKHLHKLSLICSVFVLRGNHDYTNPDNPFFAFVSRIQNVFWINKPTTPIILGGVQTLFLPHTGNWKRDWKDIEFKGTELIFAHQTFAGAKVGPRTFEGIPLDIFPDDAQVISGDIHVPQTFDVVTYVGAPYLCNFGDDYKPRVLLWNGKAAKSIPVPGPQKRLLEVDSVAGLKDCLRMVKAGDICKVRVTLHAKDAAKWPEIQERVRSWGAENGLVVHVVQPQITGKKGAATARRRADARTDQELIKLYGESCAVGAQTLKVGLELSEKA